MAGVSKLLYVFAENSKAVITRGHDDREATITFSPDLEEQTRLMGIYAVRDNIKLSTHPMNLIVVLLSKFV